MRTKNTPKDRRSAKPGELHRGQTAEQGTLHDRRGSQIERERHRSPGNTILKAGSARSNKKPKAARAAKKK
jgi:hypothetical protein